MEEALNRRIFFFKFHACRRWRLIEFIRDRNIREYARYSECWRCPMESRQIFAKRNVDRAKPLVYTFSNNWYKSDHRLRSMVRWVANRWLNEILYKFASLSHVYGTGNHGELMLLIVNSAIMVDVERENGRRFIRTVLTSGIGTTRVSIGLISIRIISNNWRHGHLM